jgi:hypothetical protein
MNGADIPNYGRRSTAFPVRKLFAIPLLLVSYCCHAQTVSPVIEQYQGQAQGRIALTNNTFTPQAVVLEPKSFSVSPEGSGMYRPLDPGIHVKLSSMSFRIDPGLTYYVFYQAKADKLPAWFTIYATFSTVNPTDLAVRILLPHTVYMYSRKPHWKEDTLEVKQATYFSKTRKVVCDLANTSPDLERVEEVLINAGSKTITAAGFPMLPGSKRHLEMDWKETDPPRVVILRMDRSTVKLFVRLDDR